MKAWVRSGQVGVSVPREGLWIGRSADSDLVVTDLRSSQLQALLTWRGTRLLLLPLGRNPTSVNRQPVTAPTALVTGDRVAVPGGEWVVEVATEAATDAATSAWVAVLPSGDRLGLGWREASFGEGPGDDVTVAGWPAGALRLHRPDSGALVAESAAALTLSGRPFEAGALEAVEPGTRIAHGTFGLTLLALEGLQATTWPSQDANLPSRVEFRFTPTGGVLTLGFSRTATVTAVDLPELRARLVAVLLRTPNEEVEDADILPAVWPGSDERTRLDLNQLVHRARRDLLAAGVDPTQLLVRSRRGGAVCFRVAAGAAVTAS